MEKIGTPADLSDMGRVVDIRRFRSGQSLSPIRQVEAYWTALRDGTGIPFRSQVDPRGLENVLEHAFILERIAPGIARFRLAGQHLTALTGMEVRGMPSTALFTPPMRNTFSAALECVFDSPAVAELSLSGETRYGRHLIEGHMIVLPLKSDSGEISRALGVLVSDGDGSNGPIRFDISGSSVRPVSGLTYAPPPEPAPHAHESLGFGEPAPRFAPAKPYLRLVKSDT